MIALVDCRCIAMRFRKRNLKKVQRKNSPAVAFGSAQAIIRAHARRLPTPLLNARRRQAAWRERQGGPHPLDTPLQRAGSGALFTIPLIHFAPAMGPPMLDNNPLWKICERMAEPRA